MAPAEPRSTLFRFVCPSGMVSGMPSLNTRTPRTPKAARAPSPRIVMRLPSEKFCRLLTMTPGTCASASSRPTVSRASWMRARSTVLTAKGARVRSCVLRMTETCSESSRMRALSGICACSAAGITAHSASA
jgi:hypothetical protein